MDVLYIANFDAGGNCDEDAIAFALRSLGHRVHPVREKVVGRVHEFPRAELLLFHKFADVGLIRSLKMAKAFWFFDLVSFPDRTLEGRCASRRQWMANIIPHVDIGFLTDGDFVDHDATGKLVHLTQGVDERQAAATASKGDQTPLLFTGIGRGGGVQRESFVKEMANRYGSRFVHVERGVHGEELRKLIAETAIVVAPDSPVTDRYCSNRVYNALGMGAFLLHPWCESLWRQYGAGEGGLVFYRDRAELHRLIALYAEQPDKRHALAEVSRAWTLRHHCYRHRVAELIRVVRERMGGRP
jgi:hypothetical protein